jgi:hypothetical protein
MEKHDVDSKCQLFHRCIVVTLADAGAFFLDAMVK